MIIRDKISSEKLNEIAGDALIVKLVVDIEKEILSAGCELHIDCAEELINAGSLNKNLWGANIYPKNKKIDFSAVFNIRPASGNRSMEIQDNAIREKVGAVIKNFYLYEAGALE